MKSATSQLANAIVEITSQTVPDDGSKRWSARTLVVEHAVWGHILRRI
jgi:hypothetical protein